MNNKNYNFRLAEEQLDFGTIFGSIKAIDINMDGYNDIAISGAVGHAINYDSFYIIDTLEISDQGDVLAADTTILLLNPRDSVWALEGKIFLNNGTGELEFTELQTIEGARTIAFVDIDQNNNITSNSFFWKGQSDYELNNFQESLKSFREFEKKSTSEGLYGLLQFHYNLGYLKFFLLHLLSILDL